MFDDLQDNLRQIRDRRFLLLAQADLVRDLEHVAHRLRTLPPKPANRQADLAHALDDRVDLVRQHQPRDVQHHAGPHAGSHVGRAGGQKTEARRERVRNVLLDLVVHRVDGLPGPIQVQSRPHDLKAHVIFFVDHDRHAFVDRRDQPAALALLGLLPAHQVPLEENLLVQEIDLAHREGKGWRHASELAENGLEILPDTLALVFAGPARERPVLEIPRQPEPAADNRAGVLPRGKPGAGLLKKVVDRHVDSFFSGPAARDRATWI